MKLPPPSRMYKTRASVHASWYSFARASVIALRWVGANAVDHQDEHQHVEGWDGAEEYQLTLLALVLGCLPSLLSISQVDQDNQREVKKHGTKVNEGKYHAGWFYFVVR